MAKVTWFLSAALLLAATSVSAQQPFPTNQQPFPAGGADKDPNRAAMANMTPTPDMWFYEQESRRHDSPENAVRRKAEFQAHARQMRIASREWYGISNSRPSVNPTPVMGTYAPTWVGNSRNPMHWHAVQTPLILNVRRVGSGPAYGLW
jgi:hypothetical protein